jgi:hypothetical protein
LIAGRSPCRSAASMMVVARLAMASPYPGETLEYAARRVHP